MLLHRPLTHQRTSHLGHQNPCQQFSPSQLQNPIKNNANPHNKVMNSFRNLFARIWYRDSVTKTPMSTENPENLPTAYTENPYRSRSLFLSFVDSRNSFSSLFSTTRASSNTRETGSHAASSSSGPIHLTDTMYSSPLAVFLYPSIPAVWNSAMLQLLKNISSSLRYA